MDTTGGFASWTEASHILTADQTYLLSDSYAYSHVGGDEAATWSPRAIKRDFRALGQFIRESGAQAIFFSGLPIAGSNTGRNRASLNT